MKIYFIDDNMDKHGTFLRIMDEAMTLAPDLNIEAGFGTDKESSYKNAMNAESLTKALKDENGIYLVDFGLTGLDQRALHDEFGNDAGWTSAINKYNKSLSLGGDVADLLDIFPNASKIILFLKERERKFLTVSVQPLGHQIDGLHEILSVEQNKPWIAFPYDLRDTETNRKKWAQIIVGFYDILTRIRLRTSGWFTNESRMPHEFNLITIEKHREIVKDVFSWMPDQWWENKVSAQSLHQNLKTAVGEHADWMGKYSDKALSLGGVLFWFLEVFHSSRWTQQCRDLAKHIDWSQICSFKKG